MTEPDPTPTTATGRPRVTTHRAIRDAAMREFASHGYAATSVQRIAEVAGIGRNTFFRYFSAKIDLLGADYAANQDVVAQHLSATPTGGDVLGQIIDAVSASIRYDDDDREFYRLRLVMLAHDPTVPPEWARPLATGWAELIAAHALAAAPDHSPRHRAVADAIGWGMRGILSAVMVAWANDEVDLAGALDLFERTAREVFGGAAADLTPPGRNGNRERAFIEPSSS